MDIGHLWNEFVVRGVFVAGLVYLYDQLKAVGIPSWGVAIILFTIVVKTLTLPLTLKSVRSMKRMQEIQPKMQALQRQYKNDKEKLMQEQMVLYKEHGVNPVAGCLPMLIQMPIWIALYWALSYLASNDPEFARPFLWIGNLGQPEFKPENFPSQLPILAVLTGVTQWITTKMSQQQSTDPQQQTMNQVMQFMPLMFIFFSLSVPAGLVLYWVTSNLYQMIQQYFITGWGQLLPPKAPTPEADAARGPTPRPAPARSASNARSATDGATVDAIATEESRAPRSASTGGRKRRTKRR